MPEATGAVLEVNDEQFEAIAAEPGWVVVDFFATWCPHCKAFRPRFDQAAASYQGPVRFLACDVDQCEQVSARFNIRSLPTVVLLRDGEKQDMKVGMMGAGQLTAWLDDQRAKAES